MMYYAVVGWDKFQHYRKDSPSWIKVYTKLLMKPEWVSLTDEEKGQLVSLWLLAAAHKGKLPCAEVCANLAHLRNLRSMQVFEKHGWIVTLDNLRTAHSRPETETETETEKQTRKSNLRTCASRFAEFWAVFPRKRDKGRAYQVWQDAKLDDIADQLIEDVKTRIQKDYQWIEGYIPYPTTYLKHKLWEDDMEKPNLDNQPKHASHKQWKRPDWMDK